MPKLYVINDSDAGIIVRPAVKRNKKENVMRQRLWWIGLLVVLIPSLALAHFMVVHPSSNIVENKSDATIVMDVRFTHPFEQGIMDNDRPRRFGVEISGKKLDLVADLAESKKDEIRTYGLIYKIKRPGDHIFFVEPAPYWEPAEGKWIVHYTKTVVHAFGLETGWDDMVGFPIEIKPLTRPYGLWAGNSFSGQVMLRGKPVPHAQVEVAYDNKGLVVSSLADAFHIQVVKADGNGVFAYTMPRAGWWGFAALEESDQQKIGPDGIDKPVEIGALIWVHAVDMK